MPTMPVKAAGWRIEPPVSVPVAPRQRRAATAAADPPNEPPVRFPAAPGGDRRPEARSLVRRAHGELVIVELAKQHGAVAPQIGADGGFIGRHEVLQDARTGSG